MERASQQKRPKVWQFFLPRCDSTNTPSKNVIEKKKLSLRSENRKITTLTPESSSSLSRQATGLTQRQPGKENESPFVLRAATGKIAKSTTKRNKSSNPTSFITNSEKKLMRRRLSGDYEDQLFSNNLYGAINPVESIIFSSKAIKPPVADVCNYHSRSAAKFSVYDDRKDSTTVSLGSLQAADVATKDDSKSRGVNEAESELRGAGNPCCDASENHAQAIPRGLDFLWKSYQRYKSREDDLEVSMSESEGKKVKNDGSSATQQMQQTIFDSRSADDQETTGVEFRIERVDSIDGRRPALAVNNFRKVKSGSDIRRLNVPLRRGNDISPLKRRIIQLKRSGMIVGTSCGFDIKGAAATAGKVDVSYSKTGLERKDTEAVGESTKSTIPFSDQTRKRKSGFQVSAVDPSTGTIKKTSRRTGTEARKNIAKTSEIEYATDYAKEIIDSEHARERNCYKISQKFLNGKIVTPEQRRIVVNFLISVHAYLLTSSSTLHQAIQMFDAILDIKDVCVKELQLVALGALWVAIKNMETKVPTASEMISFAKDMYHAEGPGLLCKCERKILKALGFNIRFPDPFYMSACYLHEWSSLGKVSNEPSILRTIHHCIGYLLDVSLLDENYSSMPRDLLAAAVTQTAADFVLNKSRGNPMEHSPRTFGKLKFEETDGIVGPLLRGVLESSTKDSSIGAVYKKYKSNLYDSISDYLVRRIKKKLPGLTDARQD